MRYAFNTCMLCLFGTILTLNLSFGCARKTDEKCERGKSKRKSELRVPMWECEVWSFKKIPRRRHRCKRPLRSNFRVRCSKLLCQNVHGQSNVCACDACILECIFETHVRTLRIKESQMFISIRKTDQISSIFIGRSRSLSLAPSAFSHCLHFLRLRTTWKLMMWYWKWCRFLI